ncbi:BatD family protein [Aquimarina hainanensis]|uniref:BatD family protein n=1 Tax=Aquimarina hainanensis TaxID=1578017 RepID=A0ABW5N730_9FLAO
MKLQLIFLTLFLTLIQAVEAQVKFEAKVSKEKLGMNERLRVDFEMNQDGDNFTPPNFSGFQVIGGPNQSISNTWVNGKRSYSKSFSYYLSPTRRGKFTIKQATIEINGETYKTLPVKVEVTASVDKPKDGNSSDVIASENLHLVAEVSKSTPYLNEAITVEYKLYVSPRINVSNWKELDSPKYSDFWSQAIDMKQLKVRNGEYNGEPYRYVVLRKTVLYPQKTGKLNIEPLTLSVTVDVPTNRRDFFGGRLYTSIDKRVAAGNRTIRVKPLPEQGRPDDFTGAVGTFEFDVKVNKKVLSATESLEARVSVFGNGNLKLFDIPTLSVPNGLEKYEPEHNERVRTNLSGMAGTISDTYTLVPQYKGKYPLPSLSFSYFDLKTESYKRITSDEIIINVNKGPEGNTEVEGNDESNETFKKVVTQVGNQFRFIKTDTTLTLVEKKYFFKSTPYWLALTLPLLAIPVFLFLGKKREERKSDVKGNRVRKADKLARKYLSEAKKNLGDQKAFYIAMEKALHNYLKAKLSIQTSDMSKERIQRLLKEKNVDEATSIEFIALLESCEFARYTPSSGSAMQQDYDKASRVIAAMDKRL